MSEIPIRREPPRFRRVRVAAVDDRGEQLRRLTLRGVELAGMEPPMPAASVRLLLPRAGADEVEIPQWDGNEFLFADGSRPPIRTLTPVRFDARTLDLDVEVVRHGCGALSDWADAARPGDAAAVSGPGRGYDVDEDARWFLVAGDESALPAITTLLPGLPRAATVLVIVEVRSPAGEVELPSHPGAEVRWCVLPDGGAPGDAMVEAVRAVVPDPDGRIWAAGEAAAVQRIRRHLFTECGFPRSHTVVRGYWKHGRAGAGSTD